MSPPTRHTTSARDLFRRQIQEQVTRGDFDAALRLCNEAIARSEAAGERDLADQAFCNRASLLIARGEGSTTLQGLRTLLLRSSDLANRFSASYAISHHYDLQGDPEKSLFYARQALRYAEQWGEDEALGRVHNSIGNLLVLESYFEEAISSYVEALRMLPNDDSIDRAILLSNLGYCRVVTGSLHQGYGEMAESLRTMRRLGARNWQHLPHLGLSYACLEVQRHERACRHALRALHLAEASQSPEGAKNALYLLGEAEKNCGRHGRAYDRFFELQNRFYPDNPMVVDILMAADVRKMINLMA